MTNKMYVCPFKKIFIAILLIATSLNFAHAKQGAKQFVVNLYGHLLTFNIEEDFYRQREICLTETLLASTVEKLIEDKNTDTLIKQMNSYASAFDMDDMAYLLLLNKVTAIVMESSTDDCKNLFKYAVLYKKDFDVFIGYSASNVTLYGRTNFMVDNCLFIERGTKKYFDLSFSQQREPNQEQLFVLHHSGKSLPIVMNMINPPLFNAKQNKKVIPFEYDAFLYFFTTKVNQSLVEYYRELPTINISTVYLNYGLSQSATQSLVNEMKLATSSMSKGEGASFILSFVQNSFEYKKDEFVYGQEKFSFPEETIMNAYADCEDKAMLYAVLVNKVLGLKTVALYYKNAEHINIAVESWNKKLKTNFSFNNQDYIVCEPSGKGFTMGESATKVSFASLIDW